MGKADVRASGHHRSEHHPAGSAPEGTDEWRSAVARIVMAAPDLRVDAVAHARALLEEERWFDARELAAALLHDLVSHHPA
jgi:hypothetical protein